MRSLFALALVLVACFGGDRSTQTASQNASPTRPARGANALMLRVPRGGGVARATAYPGLDSVVWTGTEIVPSLGRVLAFDPEGGVIAAVGADGRPVWIDLRLGGVSTGPTRSVKGLESADGQNIYGVLPNGSVARFTQSGNSSYTAPVPAQAVFPQLSGTLVFLGGRGPSAHVWRMHPPEPKILDSLALADAAPVPGGSPGDRVYFTTGGRSLVGVDSRTLARGSDVSFDKPISRIATTPSGDRLYVITDSAQELAIVSRYQDRVAGRIELPGRARDLRIDPIGRYLLVRAATGDSVWVVSVGADRVMGTVRSRWRGDVPFVAQDGNVAVQSANDIAFIDPTSMKEVRRTIGGASDFWYPFSWDGFHPRAAGLDEPVSFGHDSDSVAVGLPPVGSDTLTAVPPTPAPVDSSKLGFTVSFAALLDIERAKTEAATITVEGRTARVVTTVADGTTVYRVVLGPYPTREEAERIGHAAGRQYSIYAGSP
ncbi:MAG TPA: SPOR domain-containing protein [Gemmatimonadaceae bacterium]